MSVQELRQQTTGHAIGLAYLTDIAVGPKSATPIAVQNAQQLTWTPNAQGGVGSANIIGQVANPYTAFADGVSGVLQVDWAIEAVANVVGGNSSTYGGFRIDLVDAAVPATIFASCYVELVADPVALNQQDILNQGTTMMVINSNTIQSVANLAVQWTFVGIASTIWSAVISTPNQVSTTIKSSVF